jgi:hypothetical protein
VVCGESSVDLAEAVDLLGEHFGIRTLLLEGGGHINGAFLEAGRLGIHGKDFKEKLFIDLFTFLVKSSSQQIISHVHEQAQVAGGMFAKRLQKRRVHQFGITSRFKQVVETVEQFGRGQGFGAQSRPDATGNG